MDYVSLLSSSHTHSNLPRKALIEWVLRQKKALLTPQGNFITWTSAPSTGRSPRDTYIVRHAESEKNIDWHSPPNIPMEPELFDDLWTEAVQALTQEENLFASDRVIGADPSYALPVQLLTDNPLTTLFADNMFRPVPENIQDSILYDKSFTLLVLPHHAVNPKKYDHKVRDMVIAMDMDRQRGLILGSSYLGTVKKLMFTVMNYDTPEKGILPLHCSANQGKDGNTAVILGLSGTGKTTLSADPQRALIGDDEHGWSENGISNFENGCYAKLIHLNPEKEPEIYRIGFGEKKNTEKSSVIIENAMMYPDGKFDLDDERLTANSRISYPLSCLQNFSQTAQGGHPQTIVFLTADAHGVLPPVAKLNPQQAMLWFLMGYTSKLAGTETGVTQPVSTFSRFFGGPFMPRNPEDYTDLLNKKIVQQKTAVYLLNTGWTGGPYGIGERIDIGVTRKLLEQILSGKLKNVSCTDDTRFHFSVPTECLEVDSNILQPSNTWKDKKQYEQRANLLAREFSTHFDKMFPHLDDRVRRECPGK